VWRSLRTQGSRTREVQAHSKLRRDRAACLQASGIASVVLAVLLLVKPLDRFPTTHLGLRLCAGVTQLGDRTPAMVVGVLGLDQLALGMRSEGDLADWRQPAST
jgi:hypothetical protein